ncbi:3-oxoacyl-[acyl-carrier-protein] synthase 3, partial [mine drainage metagenome]
GVCIRMSGNEVFKVAVRTLDRIVGETLEAAGVDEAQVDWLIRTKPTYASSRLPPSACACRWSA